METIPILAGMLGTAATLIVTLVIALRRNGKNGGNPNATTLEMQFNQMITLQREGNKGLHEVQLTLVKLVSGIERGG